MCDDAHDGRDGEPIVVVFVERVAAEIIHIHVPTAHHPEREG